MEIGGRDFGKLESDVNGLKEDVAEILKLQRESREDAEQGRRRLHKIVNQLAERVIKVDSRLETAEDTLEGHGVAIKDFEQFRTEHIAQAKIALAKVETNRTWLKWIGAGIAGMGALEGDHATGGRFLKWLASLFTSGPNVGH